MKVVSKGILMVVIAILCLIFTLGVNILVSAALVWVASKVIIGVEFSWGISVFVGVLLTIIIGLLK